VLERAPTPLRYELLIKALEVKKVAVVNRYFPDKQCSDEMNANSGEIDDRNCCQSNYLVSREGLRDKLT
jgi:hypothetical protein